MQQEKIFSGKLIKGQGLFAQALVKAGCQVIDVSDFKAKIQAADRADYEKHKGEIK